MSATPHQGLPVAGYQPQSASAVDAVNINKQLEEYILRRIDQLLACDGNDRRWLSIARTHIEEGFMAMNRSIFQPGRISLPEDEAQP